ncbi:MAG: hypothetical protein ACE15C_14590 [Phycisphaerae bacterium]
MSIIVDRENTLRQAGQIVKSRIVAISVPLGEFADKAGVTDRTLSHLFAGRSRGYRSQLKVWECYRKLSGSAISFAEFWGPLASRRIAG